jgi:hypothetical protein
LRRWLKAECLCPQTAPRPVKWAILGEIRPIRVGRVVPPVRSVWDIPSIPADPRADANG